MNSVNLIGRAARDPQVNYADNKVSIARFTLAIDRGKDKDGNSRGADFPSIICFGKPAELVDKYVHKGKLLGVMGRIQTGSYEKDGVKVYTTDVVADRVEFLSTGEGAKEEIAAPDGFNKLSEEDIPF